MAQAEAGGALSHLNHELVASLNDFHDPSQEWRRLFSEALGTFFLVLRELDHPDVSELSDPTTLSKKKTMGWERLSRRSAR